MPNPYESGVKRALGDAEVDEIKEALEEKGYDGSGGSHQSEDGWTFISGEHATSMEMEIAMNLAALRRTSSLRK
jgi:hypothetical protein